MASLAEIQQLVQQIRNELPSLLQRSQVTPQQVVVSEGLSDISKRLGLVQAGEFRSGNGIEPGLGFSGVRIGYPSFTYAGEEWNVAGVDNDVLQVGIRASDGKLLAAEGHIILDDLGVTIVEDDVSELGAIRFLDTTDTLAVRFSYGAGTFQFQSFLAGGSFEHQLTFSDASTPYYIFEEDENQALRTSFEIQGGAHGGHLSMVADGLERLGLFAGDDTDDPTYMLLYSSDAASPSTPFQYWEAHVYLRNNKFIIQWNDSGTVRYKYLDLSGTGVTWVHTTSAP